MEHGHVSVSQNKDDMTKRFYIAIIAALLMMACTDEDIVQMENVGADMVPVTLNFMSAKSDDISITTRATMDEVPESRVQNFYLYFFENRTFSKQTRKGIYFFYK